ncbi:homing endonuclease EDxHD [Klebsiella phage K64-1]|uniref:homing endonuclease EDxHD n=1 Tax=Klebsiella phage K64-1 TaxID=1439894 RepID=UPI00248BA81F|nr:homing endonuclease EDxHD [Klebsiella phage K64-1]
MKKQDIQIHCAQVPIQEQKEIKLVLYYLVRYLHKNDPSLLPNLTEDDITIGLYKFNKIYTTGNLKYEKNYK